MNFSSEKDDWEIFQKISLNVVINVLYQKKRKEICSTYITK